MGMDSQFTKEWNHFVHNLISIYLDAMLTGSDLENPNVKHAVEWYADLIINNLRKFLTVKRYAEGEARWDGQIPKLYENFKKGKPNGIFTDCFLLAWIWLQYHLQVLKEGITMDAHTLERFFQDFHQSALEDLNKLHGEVEAEGDAERP